MRRLTTEERRRRRFTEAFKQEQVDLIRRGEATVAEVARMYQVKAENVSHWVRKYAQGVVMEGIVIGSRSDYDHAKALEKENQSLKQCWKFRSNVTPQGEGVGPEVGSLWSMTFRHCDPLGCRRHSSVWSVL